MSKAMGMGRVFGPTAATAIKAETPAPPPSTPENPLGGTPEYQRGGGGL